MEDVQEKPKRGRPKKVETAPEETTLALPEPEVEQPFEVVKRKRARKKPDPATAVQSDVSFTSSNGGVSFKAMRAPAKPKLEREPQQSRPYAQLHDRFAPYSHFATPYSHFAIA